MVASSQDASEKCFCKVREFSTCTMLYVSGQGNSKFLVKVSLGKIREFYFKFAFGFEMSVVII